MSCLPNVFFCVFVFAFLTKFYHPMAPKERRPTGGGDADTGERQCSTGDPAESAQSKSDVIRHMSNREIGARLVDPMLTTAERLAYAFKIHLHLCGLPSHEALVARIDAMAEDVLLAPMLRLAQEPHVLNYIVFRTILLFTCSQKAVATLARLDILSVTMDSLRRPAQEPQCLRFCVSILKQVCTSPSCRNIQVLSQLVHRDAATLWSIVHGHVDAKNIRLHVLKILSAMLLTDKGRRALLRAGSIYSVLDLLGRHKRREDLLTRAEMGVLQMMKSELTFWEEVNARGWSDVVARRAQQGQMQLRAKKSRMDVATQDSSGPVSSSLDDTGPADAAASSEALSPTPLEYDLGRVLTQKSTQVAARGAVCGT